MSSLEEKNGIGGSDYWRSLGELADTPKHREALAREFPEGAVDSPGPFSRRRFLQLMSASIALAGFSGCRWPKEKIVPYAHRPEEMVPGMTRRFATAREEGGFARSLLVTSYDGRPIKVEGNAGDPIGGGATDPIDQASLLDLYDPDRSRGPVRRGGNQETRPGWGEFTAWMKERLRERHRPDGNRLWILSEPTSSLTTLSLRGRLAEARPAAGWVEYDPLSRDNRREGARLVFGRPLRSRVDPSRAKILLTLDADLFGDDPAALGLARGFTAGRRVEEGEMNRLYTVESAPSITGAMADHRLPVEAGLVGLFALTLARELAVRHRIPLDDHLARELEKAPGPERFPGRFVEALAEDLASNRGRSIVAAGDRQPPETHAAVLLLNGMLGNLGGSVTLEEETGPDRPDHFEAIVNLADAIEAGKVETLIVLGGNPAYDGPADLDLPRLLEKVPETIHLSLHRNETSLLSTWHLPRAHYLESWDAGRLPDGSLASTQPLIEPLYGGKSAAELLSILADETPQRGYEITREAVGPLAPAGESFEGFWRKLLHEGVFARKGTVRPAPPFDGESLAGAIGRLANADKRRGEGFELLFAPDHSLRDGRYANNGWLQELPDPLTRITWDNAAILGPSAAELLGVKSEELIRIEREGRSVEIPAFVLPGVAPRTILLPLGYGRKEAGRVGDRVGTDTYRVRDSAAPWIAGGAAVSKIGGSYPLACTQDHHLIDPLGARERERRVSTLVREVEAEEYRKNPEKAMRPEGGHHPPLVSLWKEHAYEGHSWGMAIDLNACTGCNACVVACQAENNIPVVGKEQVRAQREMHWLRVDRYYKGDPENPESVCQPVACVHCENAPCEEVCPVAATVHSDEGLNTMVYNRCIGTRYCSNNCPYKVRRFNFFNYHKNLEPTEKMAFNPEVTVRSRGVMEKCTYCVQRIQRGKIDAKNENRPVEDGEITPACAQACPTDAIVFGDLNDEKSRVAERNRSNRAYSVLGELNLKPHTNYLARVRNRNPKLAKESVHEPKHG